MPFTETFRKLKRSLCYMLGILGCRNRRRLATIAGTPLSVLPDNGQCSASGQREVRHLVPRGTPRTERAGFVQLFLVQCSSPCRYRDLFVDDNADRKTCLLTMPTDRPVDDNVDRKTC